MGIIIVDEIMVMHLIFSLMTVSKRNLVGCQLVGLIGVFATFASAAYHLYLSELINTLSKVFNPKDLSHLKYHFYAIMFGLIFSMVSIITEDIGITVDFFLLISIVLRKLWSSKRINARVLLCDHPRICSSLVHLVCHFLLQTSQKRLGCSLRLEAALHLPHSEHLDLFADLGTICSYSLPIIRSTVRFERVAFSQDFHPFSSSSYTSSEHSNQNLL